MDHLTRGITFWFNQGKKKLFLYTSSTLWSSGEQTTPKIPETNKFMIDDISQWCPNHNSVQIILIKIYD